MDLRQVAEISAEDEVVVCIPHRLILMYTYDLHSIVPSSFVYFASFILVQVISSVAFLPFDLIHVPSDPVSFISSETSPLLHNP